MSGVAPVAAAAELPFSLPPGFRFHPTDEELVNCYLRRKVLGHGGLHLNFIPEVHIYKFEPYELPDKSFSPSGYDPGARVEWYLFGPRGRKYPNGLRMERATQAGFWKSTGKDRPVMHHHAVVGMKKTLVYHLGRAPHGMRTGWVMHEYRIHPYRRIWDTYALCRVFNKNVMTPSLDVPSGVDADMERMQPVLGGADVDKEGIQPVSRSAATEKDEIHPMSTSTDVDKEGIQHVSGGADVGKEGIQPVSCSVGMKKDEIQPVSVGTDANKDEMQPVSSGADIVKEGILPVSRGTDVEKDEIQPVCVGTDMDKDEMQPVSGGAGPEEDNSWMHVIADDIWYPATEADMDKEGMRSMPGGADTDKEGMQFVTGGSATDKGGTQFVAIGVDVDKGEKHSMPGGDDTDGNNSCMQLISDNAWYTSALADEDNSWIRLSFDDPLYTNTDTDKESWMQFIFDNA